MHFHAPRLIALRGGDRNKETPKQRIREMRVCAAPAHVHSAHAIFAAGAQLAAHTQPALRTGLMAPAWRLLHVSRRAIPDLTCSPGPSCFQAYSVFSHGCPLGPGCFQAYVAFSGESCSDALLLRSLGFLRAVPSGISSSARTKHSRPSYLCPSWCLCRGRRSRAKHGPWVTVPV